MKEANGRELVAVIAPRPTRWDFFVMGILGASLVLVAWMQYSYVEEARLRRMEGIPQIVAPATVEAETVGEGGNGG